MTGAVKKLWPVLALAAGVALILFELTQRGGPTSESWFWLFVGGLIIVMAGIDLYQKWRGVPQRDDDRPGLQR